MYYAGSGCCFIELLLLPFRIVFGIIFGFLRAIFHLGRSGRRMRRLRRHLDRHW